MLQYAAGFVAGAIVAPVALYFVIRNNVSWITAQAKRLGVKLP